MQSILIASGIYLGIVFLAARNRGSAITCAGIGILLSVFLMVVSSVLGLHIFVASFVLLVAAFCTENKWHYRGVVAAATVLVYGFAFHSAWRHQQEMAEVRETLPMILLEDRLSYEPKTEQGMARVNFSEHALRALEKSLTPDTDEDYPRLRHRRALEELHRSTTFDFERSPGFGSARMRPTTKETFVLPKDVPIALPASSAHPLSAEDFLRESTPLSVKQRDELEAKASKVNLWTLHHKGVVDFIEPSMLGVVKSRSLVLGFVPHHFQKMPTMEEAQRWQVTTLELVSILKHEEPVAYVSPHLPRMSELHKAPTRPLTAFEKLGLDHLKKGDDLHVDYAPEMIRMVGSLRAGNVCLECHSAQRGQLLGAFVYRLEAAAGK